VNSVLGLFNNPAIKQCHTDLSSSYFNNDQGLGLSCSIGKMCNALQMNDEVVYRSKGNGVIFHTDSNKNFIYANTCAYQSWYRQKFNKDPEPKDSEYYKKKFPKEFPIFKDFLVFKKECGVTVTNCPPFSDFYDDNPKNLEGAVKRYIKMMGVDDKKINKSIKEFVAEAIHFEEESSKFMKARLLSVDADLLLRGNFIKYKKYILQDKKLVDKLEKRYDEIFKNGKKEYDQTKLELLSFLESKKTTDNSKEIQAMIDRIKTVKLNKRPLNDNKIEKLCKGLNAFYSPSDNRITVCPSMLMAPAQTLKQTILHELGHSIDPCFMGLTLVQVDIDNPLKPGEKVTIYQSTSAEMAQTKMAKIPGLSFFDQGMNYEDNPFKGVMSCYEGGFGISMGTHSEEELIKMTKNGIKVLEKDKAKIMSRKSILKPNIYKEYMNDIDENIRTRQGILQSKNKENFFHCNDPLAGDDVDMAQSGEVFSDWLSFQVINKQLKGRPAKEKKRLVFESVVLDLANYCSSLPEYIDTQSSSELVELGCQEELEIDQFDVDLEAIKEIALPSAVSKHPKSELRILNIGLGAYEIEKALGCEGQSAMCFNMSSY
jgi:hypothetical protein